MFLLIIALLDGAGLDRHTVIRQAETVEVNHVFRNWSLQIDQLIWYDKYGQVLDFHVMKNCREKLTREELAERTRKYHENLKKQDEWKDVEQLPPYIPPYLPTPAHPSRYSQGWSSVVGRKIIRAKYKIETWTDYDVEMYHRNKHLPLDQRKGLIR